MWNYCSEFEIVDCGLRPGGAIGAYAPEGFWIGGIAALYQLIVDRVQLSDGMDEK